jgi:outer membrane protein
MKFVKSIICSLLLLGTALTAFAQTPAPPAGAPAAETPASPLPNPKIGIVSIAAFSQGVDEMKLRYQKLEAEFATIRNTIESKQASLAAKEKTLNDNAQKMTPLQIRKLSEEIEELKKQLQRDSEDAQTRARKREEEETSPVFEKISQFMQKYAQMHGLTLVIEGGAANSAVVYIDARADVTEDFMREYNKANPVAAGAMPAAATAAPSQPEAAKPAAKTPLPTRTAGRRPGQ